VAAKALDAGALESHPQKLVYQVLFELTTLQSKFFTSSFKAL
jgi:hypothetical protein